MPSSQPSPSGRLELTWTNKHLRLIDRLDGSYEWVEPSDWRVAEVRLLRDRDAVGETNDQNNRPSDNLLIEGDALAALRALTELPEFASEYVGGVRLAYIDVPFNTGQTFESYDDALEHSVWLTMMRDRLAQIRKLLRDDGSAWVHLDDSEVHRGRSVLDEIFGPDNFVATIIWEKTHTRENRTDISTGHEYIHVYARNRSVWSEARNLLPPSEEQLSRYTNPDDDPRGPWASLPAHAKAEKGRRKEQFYTVTTPSGREVTPPSGRCWLHTRGRFDEMVADNRIWFGEDGSNVPRVKKFLSEVQTGLVPKALWLREEVGTTATAKSEMTALFPDKTPFSTPKPERLLKRIVHIGSDPGDVVLDCFAGSATTAAVAHKMGRRWVAVEREADTVIDFAEPRLRKVVAGDDPGGVTKDVAWEGGGGFRILDVAPSMFEPDADGRVWLAEWATDSQLAEATAAQLGFAYEPHGPFVGIKGRVRLAVIDGLVNDAVLEALAESLGDAESMLVAGTAVAQNATEQARKLAKGSRVRKIPSSILASWRRTERVG